MSKNASSLIVQSSRTLPKATCLTKPTNGLFQQALDILNHFTDLFS
ncbi:hypothetical protein Dacsa_2052 [Dactylococcopsis salina PCC 8305]|uniref:Uncharacterized protein n=1 Tax=Dactylococcopsis salina (strain PCC 8305) TaxID=13035 RepID=K9YUY7_DACS8|nr:hypothetical protein Dacsa_2052 [Dactylococcopsis salina PCC 8305]